MTSDRREKQGLRSVTSDRLGPCPHRAGEVLPRRSVQEAGSRRRKPRMEARPERTRQPPGTRTCLRGLSGSASRLRAEGHGRAGGGVGAGPSPIGGRGHLLRADPPLGSQSANWGENGWPVSGRSGATWTEVGGRGPETRGRWNERKSSQGTTGLTFSRAGAQGWQVTVPHAPTWPLLCNLARTCARPAVLTGNTGQNDGPGFK